MSYQTTYTEEQELELCRQCSLHGITPPYRQNYIKDTVYDMLKALMETMDKVRELSEGRQNDKS